MLHRRILGWRGISANNIKRKQLHGGGVRRKSNGRWISYHWAIPGRACDRLAMHWSRKHSDTWTCSTALNMVVCWWDSHHINSRCDGLSWYHCMHKYFTYSIIRGGQGNYNEGKCTTYCDNISNFCISKMTFTLPADNISHAKRRSINSKPEEGTVIPTGQTITIRSGYIVTVSKDGGWKPIRSRD